MKQARLLLKQLTLRFPPAKGCSHNLTLEDGKLQVTLMLEMYHTFVLHDESDYELSVDELVEITTELMNHRANEL